MADDDLAKLRIDKAQFTQRRAKKSRLLVLLPALAILLGAGVLYAKGMLTPAVEVRVASVATLYPRRRSPCLTPAVTWWRNAKPRWARRSRADWFFWASKKGTR